MPEELRDLILTFAVAAHPARLVELRRNVVSRIAFPPSQSPSAFLSPTTVKEKDQSVEVTFSLTSPARIPALLHVSSRSRELAKRRWELTFPAAYYDSEGVRIKGLEDTARTYFDFETDLLTFNGDTTSRSTIDLSRLLQLVSPSLVARIENVSIGLYGPLQPHGGWQGAREEYAGQSRGDRFALFFPGLRSVVVVWRTLGEADERSVGFKIMKSRTEEEEETRIGLERGVNEGRNRRGLKGEKVPVELAVLGDEEAEEGSMRRARFEICLFD